MADLFKSPKSMLGRAKRHLSDLEAQVSAFSHEKPWAMVVEDDADGVRKVLKVKFTERLSDDLPHIVFDCVNNLRSALDQAAHAIGRKHTGTLTPKSAKFPFGPTEADMLNNLRGGCKDLPTEIRDLFAAFKPYKGGNNALWAMNELCNAPKHRTLFPVVVGGQSWGLTDGIVTGGIELRGPTWNSEENEIILARYGPQTIFHGNIKAQVAFAVALDDVDEAIRGQEPVKVIRAMTGEVERVLVASERECRRIDLIK